MWVLLTEFHSAHKFNLIHRREDLSKIYLNRLSRLFVWSVFRILQVKSFTFIQYRVTLNLNDKHFEEFLNAELQISSITEAIT